MGFIAEGVRANVKFVRLLADGVSYSKSYFEILAQKGKKLFFDQK